MTNMKPPQEGRNTGAPSLRGLQGRSATGLNGQAAKDEVSAVWRGGWMPENISGVPAGRSVFHLTSPFIGLLGTHLGQLGINELRRAAKARHDFLRRTLVCVVMGVHSRRCARCLVPSAVLGEGRGECMIFVTNSGCGAAAFGTRKPMLITSTTIIHSHSCSSPMASGSVLESTLARAVSRGRRSRPPDQIGRAHV